MSSSSQNQQDQKKPSPTTEANPSASLPKPVSAVQQKQESEEPVLFHFAECTNCRHILPISTTTEKYFPILSKDPKKPIGLGEKCMRCGADSWVLVTG